VQALTMAGDPTITSLMAAAEAGTPGAAKQLFAALYDNLHRLAQRQLAGGGAGASLGVTTLLHEAYLCMGADGTSPPAFPDRARFMGYAARVMRGLIIDHVRRRRAQKRGGQFVITTLDVDVAAEAEGAEDLARISDALDELASIDPPLAEIVDLKFFCGFCFAEIAAMRAVSERTVQRAWEKARIFLHRSVRSDLPG
jgi:RNA polymerase sigma factor (TIGR02999 family)